VRESGYIKSHWQYTLLSFCSTHQREHINLCPHCKQELQWNTSLLELICQRCNGSLVSDICETPTHISKLNTLSRHKKVGYIVKLSDYAEKLLRPFDLMKKRLSENPRMIENWNVLYTEASNIIESDAEVPSAYALHCDENLAKDYKDYSISSMANEFKNNIGRAPSNLECRQFIDKNSIMNCLGLNHWQSQLYIRAGLIEPIFKKGKSEIPIYLLSDWKIILKRIRPLLNEGVDIKKVENEAPLFGNPLGTVAVGVLRGKIPCRFKDPNMPNFEGAYIDREAAHYYFRKQRRISLEQNLKVYDASTLLGTEHFRVMNFVRAGVLKTVHTGNQNILICANSLKLLAKTEHFMEREKVLSSYPPEISFNSQSI